MRGYYQVKQPISSL